MDPSALDLDTQFRLLADAERRQVLTILTNSDLPVTFRDIATELVTNKHEAPLPETPPDEMTNIYTRLSHMHLPRLADAGVIEYDADRQRITNATLDEFEWILDAITDTTTE